MQTTGPGRQVPVATFGHQRQHPDFIPGQAGRRQLPVQPPQGHLHHER
ncbi:hypothetical protein LTSERUB_2133, partial [Salmonella enterica subsp. enterica serovar Rubislaw str. A4-653]